MMKKYFICLLVIIGGGLILSNDFAQAKGVKKIDYNKRINAHFPEKARNGLLSEGKKQASNRYKNESKQFEFTYYFLEGYLFCLQEQRGTVTMGSPLAQRGFDEGSAFFNSQVKQNKQNLTLNDFGYEPMTVAGPYEQGFEVSVLEPEGLGETWWCIFNINADKQMSRLFPGNHLAHERKVCTFKGYLAPNRGHKVGHMNWFDREFLVTDVIRVS